MQADLGHSAPDSIVAFDSSVAFIDPHAGELLYRGYDINDIADRLSFMQTVFLLWEGQVPTPEESLAFADELATYRELPDAILELLLLTPDYAHPMATLRTAVSMLACVDPDQEEAGREANQLKAKKLVAQMPTIVAAQHRIRQGLEPIEPDASLSHSANYLYMMTGKRPDEAAVRALTVAMNVYAEHEMNASTFTARLVVGTLSDLYSAVVAAIGALKGPLHGGAVDAVMRMLMSIGFAERAPTYAEETLAVRGRLPGFGQTASEGRDPRARHMKEVLAVVAPGSPWLEIAERLRSYVESRTALQANLDLYAAPVLTQLGFPLELLTNFVASARVAGWAAHILEQYGDNRLLRLRARYVGPRLGQSSS